MKFFISFLAFCLLISCDNKKTATDKSEKTEEEETESGWSSKDQKKAIADCKTFVSSKMEMSTNDLSEFCNCVLNKVRDGMTFDEFQAVYEKEERPANEKEGKAYDKLEKAGDACMEKMKPEEEGTEKKPSDDDDQ